MWLQIPGQIAVTGGPKKPSCWQSNTVVGLGPSKGGQKYDTKSGNRNVVVDGFGLIVAPGGGKGGMQTTRIKLLHVRIVSYQKT